MITLTTPNTEKLTIKGTSIEISSVLLRLEFTAPISGKTIQVACYAYENEAAFNADPKNLLSIEGVEGFTLAAKDYDLSNGDDPETWKAQTISVAHDEAKAYFDGLGYLATISGI
jgi:hypothetical protein